jgi:hypothetical protein
MRKPLPLAEVKDALTCLAQNLKDNKAKPDFSFRTSVHVHINCQELTYNQYLNFLYTYFLLEEPLMTFCGRERKGNRFCLRLQDAEGMLETFNRMFQFQEEDGFAHIPPNKVRYSAMNIEATTKYGSLEFRGMKGNMDVDYINDWVMAISYLRAFAQSVEDPTKVYDLYAELEAQGFMEHVLKELAPKFYYARASRDVQRSFSLSLDLPFRFGEQAAIRKAAQKRVAPRAPKAMRVPDVIEPVQMPDPQVVHAGIMRNNPAADILAQFNDPFARRLRADAAPRAVPVRPRAIIRDEF